MCLAAQVAFARVGVDCITRCSLAAARRWSYINIDMDTLGEAKFDQHMHMHTCSV